MELKRIRECEKALCNYYLFANLMAEVSTFNSLYTAWRASLPVRQASLGHAWRPFGSKNIVSWLLTNGMKNPNESIDGEICDAYFSSNGHDALFLHSLLVSLGKLEFDSIHTLPDAKDYIFGSGISKAIEMIFARRVKRQLGRVYVLLEDVELLNGGILEPLQHASNEKMSELTVIVDHAVCNDNLGDICLKFRAFEWMAQECNGHDFKAIDMALASLRNNSNGKPQVLLANMIRGKFGNMEYEKIVEGFKIRLDCLMHLAGLGKISLESVEI